MNELLIILLALSANAFSQTAPQSADDTVVTSPGTTIIDSQGNVWALTSGGQVSENGTVISSTSGVDGIAYIDGSVWQIGGTTTSVLPANSVPAAPTQVSTNATLPVNGQSKQQVLSAVSTNTAIAPAPASPTPSASNPSIAPVVATAPSASNSPTSTAVSSSVSPSSSTPAASPSSATSASATPAASPSTAASPSPTTASAPASSGSTATAQPSLPATTILGQGCFNARAPSGTDPVTGISGYLPWGGPAAKGDGQTDDTNALNACFAAAGTNTFGNYYIPSGTYLCSGQLNEWTTFKGHIFGEPSNRPTLELKANSGASGVFLYIGMPFSAGSTNNSFEWYEHDFNVTVDSGNTGITAAVGIASAQAQSLRNMVITRNDSSGYCLESGDNNTGDLATNGDGGGGSGGGGGTVANVVTQGGSAAALINDAEIAYRGCTFNGPVTTSGGWTYNFINCVFNGAVTVGGLYNGFINCTLQGTPAGGAAWDLQNCTVNGALVSQQSSADVYCNGNNESGTSTNLNTLPGIVSPFPEPALPEPNSSCVSITQFGGSPSNGDNTEAFKSALAQSSQIYFPMGTYNFSGTLNIPAGTSIWGAATGRTSLNGGGNPAFTVNGAGTGKGVNLTRIALTNSDSSAVICQWNGDATSVLTDCNIDGQSGNGPWLVVQSGGFYMDDAWPTGNTSNPTWMQYNAQGPTYIVGVEPEHYGGQAPVMVINNAANLWVVNWETEILTGYSTPVISIANSTNINFNGTVGGGGTFPEWISIDNNSNVSLFGIGEADGPQVGCNGSMYGSGGGSLGLLQGFVTGNN